MVTNPVLKKNHELYTVYNVKTGRFFLSARIANGIVVPGKHPLMLLPNFNAAHTTLKEHRCCTAKLFYLVLPYVTNCLTRACVGA